MILYECSLGIIELIKQDDAEMKVHALPSSAGKQCITFSQQIKNNSIILEHKC